MDEKKVTHRHTDTHTHTDTQTHTRWNAMLAAPRSPDRKGEGMLNTHLIAKSVWSAAQAIHLCRPLRCFHGISDSTRLSIVIVAHPLTGRHTDAHSDPHTHRRTQIHTHRHTVTYQIVMDRQKQLGWPITTTTTTWLLDFPTLPSPARPASFQTLQTGRPFQLLVISRSSIPSLTLPTSSARTSGKMPSNIWPLRSHPCPSIEKNRNHKKN